MREEPVLTTALESRFTVPLYTVTEAAAYVGVPGSPSTRGPAATSGALGRRPVHGEPLLTGEGDYRCDDPVHRAG